MGVEVKGPEQGSTHAFADRWARALHAEAAHVAGVEVLGPVPAFVGRVKKWWRMHLLVKAPRSLPASVLNAVVRAARDKTRTPSGHRVNLDVDPVGLY